MKIAAPFFLFAASCVPVAMDKPKSEVAPRAVAQVVANQDEIRRCGIARSKLNTLLDSDDRFACPRLSSTAAEAKSLCVGVSFTSDDVLIARATRRQVECDRAEAAVDTTVTDLCKAAIKKIVRELEARTIGTDGECKDLPGLTSARDEMIRACISTPADSPEADLQNLAVSAVDLSLETCKK